MSYSMILSKGVSDDDCLMLIEQWIRDNGTLVNNFTTSEHMIRYIFTMPLVDVPKDGEAEGPETHYAVQFDIGFAADDKRIVLDVEALDTHSRVREPKDSLVIQYFEEQLKGLDWMGLEFQGNRKVYRRLLRNMMRTAEDTNAWINYSRTHRIPKEWNIRGPKFKFNK